MASKSRWLYALLFVVLAGGVWRAAENYRMKHPVSGREITVPGPSGVNAMLMSGWKTTPAGRQLASGDMILSGAVSPDGKLFAFTNTGYTRHALHIVDLETEKEIASVPLDRSWSGLVFAPDGRRIYVSGGVGNVDNDILYVDRWDSGGWKAAGADNFVNGYNLFGAAKNETAVSWLGISADGALLYALNNSDNQLYILETRGGRGVGRVKVGDHPLSARLSKDGKTVYVANLGSASVSIVDVGNPGRPEVTATLATDPHPNDLVVTSDDRLFVSCGHTNNVIAFDLRTRERLETISTALGPKAPAGSTPVSLALSPDGGKLYVANADNNSVAVVEIEDRGRSKPLGFLPTGWYPTFVTTSRDGRKIIVASSKGSGTGPSMVKRPIDPIIPAVSFLHHANQLGGLVSFVDTPDAKRLAGLTKQVYDNTLYRDVQLVESGAAAGSILPARVGETTPITHVLFIMKENRTYDQVFGDLKEGNGDPSLTLFGRDVTPNQHALAEQFVLLDNLYASGEVSQDGQPWTTSAYANEFTQRAWTLGYARHGRVNPANRIGEQSTPYIWELAKEKGLRVMTFGMGTRRGVAEVRSTRFEQEPEEPRLEERDSRSRRSRDYVRADRFLEEFQEMDRAGSVPNFMFMSLGENHTTGTTPGAFTPKAQVASNDIAVGKIVEAVTKSRVWGSFAIFIIEDDAQNGPDHVDSHRTAGLVISPYVKHGFVDSTMYSTVSMLRTVELLLGLPPMTQHDASAAPMVNSFTAKADLSTFTAMPAAIDIMARNPANGYGAAVSARMDFSDYDRVDEDSLNRILWHSIKGESAPYPAPVRRALPTPYGMLRFSEKTADKRGIRDDN